MSKLDDNKSCLLGCYQSSLIYYENKMKLIWIFLLWFFSLIIWLVSAEDFRYDFMSPNEDADMWRLLNSQKSVINEYKDSMNLDEDTATWHVQSVVNYFLWIIAFLSLIMIIYSFYMIFFSGKGEEAVWKAKKYIFWSIIAIVVSWIAWYVVSFMFYIFEKTK